MKNVHPKILKKSEVLSTSYLIFEKLKKVMLVVVFAVFFISCNAEPELIENQNAELLQTEQQNQLNAQRIYYNYGIIVRNWGSHNVDCSQPNGFCYNVWTITWRSLFIPQPTGTPVLVANENGKFVMKIEKSALTAEHKKVLLRNGGVYVIPEGQTIAPELVKSLKFNSDILVPGKYRIQGSEETYTISINVK